MKVRGVEGPWVGVGKMQTDMPGCQVGGLRRGSLRVHADTALPCVGPSHPAVTKAPMQVTQGVSSSL